jgi:hypothetical protein
LDSIRIASYERAVDEAELGSEDDDERRQLKAMFPHSVVLEGAYPEHDFATRWCWQNCGECHGECHEMYSEYPGCPLVLATGRIERIRGRDVMKYEKVAAHLHQGSWTKKWLGKTAYDYGFGEFYFASEADLERFISAVPTFSWGENYDPAWRDASRSD